MPTVFTAREIAESAVEKEMKRRDFYANVTKLSTNPEMTKLFEFLTAEEDRHVATFVKLRDGVPVEEVRPEEYDADMQAYISGWRHLARLCARPDPAFWHTMLTARSV